MALVVAQDADRITRDPGHRMLLDEEFDRRGCRLKALDDWGDESHEGQFLKFLRGWVSKGERLKIAERTRRGRRQKSKQGLLVAPSTVPYGFRLNEARDGYLVNDEKMAVVRRMFQMVTDGAGLYHVKRTLRPRRYQPLVGANAGTAPPCANFSRGTPISRTPSPRSSASSPRT